jgi:hypothetical protein
MEVKLGRSTENDIVLNDPSVSRHHAVILKTDNEYFVTDLGSSNGTYVNGRQIQGGSVLKPNDILKLGVMLVPWMSYFNVQTPNSNDRTQYVEKGHSSNEEHRGLRESAASASKSVNLNTLTKPSSVARTTFGILFLIFGLGMGVVGLAAISSSQQTYEDNNMGVYDDIQVGSTYENEQSREAGAVGVAFLVGGFALTLTGIILLATKSSSQRKYDAEIELLKKIQS